MGLTVGRKYSVSEDGVPEDYNLIFLEGQDEENGGPGRANVPARLISLSACTALSTEAFRYLGDKFNLDIHD